MNTPMTRKQKDIIINEFKSTTLEKSYPQIKRKMLYKLNTLNCNIVYSSATLATKINEKYKQECYIHLLSKIIKSINDELIVIVFDAFGNKKFEKRIIDSIKCLDNVKSIRADNSYNNKGLQFVDNDCGVIRKHLSGIKENDYYKIIGKKIRRI